MAEIIVPIAGMIFVLSVIFGRRMLASLDSYFKSKQLANSDELMDRLDQLDDLEERMRVVETVIAEENIPLKKKFADLERGSPS
ncbi:MAG: hypothetical protein QGI68_09515 [Pseudomonadales bacterium]|jgi:hypothetical protein|nr:hypothetical protein [Pseudomonadales bacterium]MDP7358960.1 hypothetical protein [Pseudomonadales bacterium]MDP7595793.1 hypothetical protein [Pseudomonadales bacterium]HJN48910.1 hypothetical protein [Pseudomonadales bacterium]|tara:strand:+ start:754 stop:1005 length:252 start_codon:yes stop_codon:yes gene_type:complete